MATALAVAAILLIFAAFFTGMWLGYRRGKEVTILRIGRAMAAGKRVKP
jgi:hypothetical protein